MSPTSKSHSHRYSTTHPCDKGDQQSTLTPWSGTVSRMSHHGTSHKDEHEPENVKSNRAKIWKLSIVLGISIAFSIVEISIGFKTGALALIADAFHYLNDIVAYIIALVATQLSRKETGPMGYTFAYRRADILGAFFNASFLIALALSILLQSIERFIYVEEVDRPLWVMVVGCCGLALNIISIMVVHGLRQSTRMVDTPMVDTPMDVLMDILAVTLMVIPMDTHISSPINIHTNTFTDIITGIIKNVIMNILEDALIHSQHHHARHEVSGQGSNRNLGLLGVIVHLVGDAINNIGVIVAAAIMWKLPSPKRFYADPAVSLVIAVMIFFSAIPLAKQTSRVLMEAAPEHIKPQNVKEDLMTIPGVISIHDLHLWHLTENEILASVRVRAKVHHIEGWWPIEKELRKCFAAQGVTQITISPEFEPMGNMGRPMVGDMNQSRSWFPTWFVTHSHTSTISTDGSKA